MHDEPSRRAEILFYEALEKPVSERWFFLNEVCERDDATGKELAALLHAYQSADQLLPADSAASTAHSEGTTRKITFLENR